MLNSSTPDGLAPISNTTVIILSSVFLGLPFVWALCTLIVNFVINRGGQGDEKNQEIKRKSLRGLLDVVKNTCGISLVVTIIFFLVIMGAVGHFRQFKQSLMYLFGALNSIVICLLSSINSAFTLKKVVEFSKFSFYDTFNMARKSACSQIFFFLTYTLFILIIIFTLKQKQISEEEEILSEQEIIKNTKYLIFFAFGSTTVSLICRICNSIYSKSVEMAIDMLPLTQNRLPRNHKNPALLMKSLGEVLNKVTSNILDSVTYFVIGLAFSVYSAGTNIIGTDQKGEIIFELNLKNCYAGILSLLFSFIFFFLINFACSFVLKPNSADQIVRYFNIQKYSLFIFLSGFQSLAIYLALPAQFVLKQGSSLRHPYHAYLCVLFGMIICLLFTISGELTTNHPFFVSIISNSCSTGSATNIIYGLSFGYFFNFVPFIFFAFVVYISDVFLGSLGVCLVAVGYLAFLPLILINAVTNSYLENGSYLSFIAGQDEQTVKTLISASQCKKDVDPQLLSYHYGIMAFIGYCGCRIYIDIADIPTQISLKSPSIFFGLILGAMFPYLFSSALIKSVHKIYLAISFDLSNQIENIPSMAEGMIDADFVRTNNLFSLKCIFSLRRFIGNIIQTLMFGIGTGPRAVLGLIVDLLISSAQIGLSSVICDSIWYTTKTIN